MYKNKNPAGTNKIQGLGIFFKTNLKREASLDAGDEAQVERAGDMDHLQGERGGTERERDGINDIHVHQKLFRT